MPDTICNVCGLRKADMLQMCEHCEARQIPTWIDTAEAIFGWGIAVVAIPAAILAFFLAFTDPSTLLFACASLVINVVMTIWMKGRDAQSHESPNHR